MELARAAERISVVSVRCVMVAFLAPALARADTGPSSGATPTFAYTTEADPDYLRALLEMSSVIAVGLLWYMTTTDIAARDYDLNYSWPVFRKKLTGEAIGFDTNHFGTNFIGHPAGGTGYYLATRSNRLNIAAAFGLTLGGSLLWEYFGEVSERVSLNDMIVTPVAGIAIGEPLVQLGAFFDRSSPALHNRVLAVVFAPIKSLNDALDGLTPARATHTDRNGFPRGEWHAFDLGAGVAATVADPTDAGGPHDWSLEYRIGLASRLVRLPGYGGVGRQSTTFDDANVSSMTLAGAFTDAGLVDFEFATDAVLFGYHGSSGERLASGELWSASTLFGLETGYEYSLHDYDRDRDRPLDRVSSVRLGVMLEQTSVFGTSRVFARVAAHACFAGVTPYALPEYGDPSNAPDLPPVTRYREYYFGVGGCFAGGLGVAAGPFEALGSLRYESYELVGGAIDSSDRRTRFGARAGSAIPNSPIRLTGFVDRRERSGSLGSARAERGELSFGVEIGARF